MPGASSFSVTTALLVVGAVLVAYLRVRNWLDSNIPLVYYGVMVVYTNAFEGRLSPWVIYSGLVLGLLLRFEFMNLAFTKAVKAMEMLVLSIIIWDCTVTIFR